MRELVDWQDVVEIMKRLDESELVGGIIVIGRNVHGNYRFSDRRPEDVAEYLQKEFEPTQGNMYSQGIYEVPIEKDGRVKHVIDLEYGRVVAEIGDKKVLSTPIRQINLEFTVRAEQPE